MGHRLAKLALSAALALGLYEGANATLPPPPVTLMFNDSAAPPLPPNVPAPAEFRLPGLQEPDTSKQEVWRIRLGSWEMAAGGHHTFLEFAPYCKTGDVCPDKGDIYQIHGIAMDEVRKDYAQLDFGKMDSYTRYESGDYVLKALGVNQDHNQKFFRQNPDHYVDIFYGSKEEVLKRYLAGMKIVDSINARNDSYLLFQHNSNSVQHTLLEGLGLDMPPLYVPHRLTALAGRVWCPGIGLSLLPGGWNRDDVVKQGGYDHMNAADLEKAARKVSGAERMFATFRPLPPQVPRHKGPAA